MSYNELPKNYLGKLKLVVSLFKTNSIIFDKVIDKYPNADFYKKILSLSSGWDKADDLKLNQILTGTNHHRDSRSPRLYAFNIILNWLVEDLIFWNLYRSNIDVKKNGSDKNRVLLSGKNVTADSDLKIKKSNELIYIEVISNYPTHKGYSSFWEQDGSFDLRDNKLSNMLLESKNAKVYIIGVVVAKSAFFIMQIDKNIKVNKVSSQKNIGFKKTNQIIFKNKEIQLNPINKLQEHIK
ncbi:hypothetical protein N8819_00130 [Gammaproteobacteria bacterium]|nr:hypothetical protein [Gammaproteobacteria bacterium]MDC0006210.1 hypothetical protein [Gammaproteobacteria bacterium]